MELLRAERAKLKLHVNIVEACPSGDRVAAQPDDFSAYRVRVYFDPTTRRVTEPPTVG